MIFLAFKCLPGELASSENSSTKLILLRFQIVWLLLRSPTNYFTLFNCYFRTTGNLNVAGGNSRAGSVNREINNSWKVDK